jgi:hypothetical protein
MPSRFDYQTLLQTLAGQGIRSVYHHGGAFEFDSPDVHFRGWLTQPDPTIRPALRDLTRLLPTDKVIDATIHLLTEAGDRVCLLPTSHWAHELEAHAWIEELLASQSFDSTPYRGLNRAEPIIYVLPAERDGLRRVLASMLERLSESDFSLVVPGAALLGTVHHHRQVWWRTPDVHWAGRIDANVS